MSKTMETGRENSVVKSPTALGAANESPLKESLLAATEERMRNILGGPLVELEVLSKAVSPEAQAGSARKRAAERIKKNPRAAVVARLRRMNVDSQRLESGLEASGEPAKTFPVDGLRADDVINGLERLIGRNDLLGVQYLEKGQLAARAVGRVLVRGSLGGLIPMGTGFLVSPRLLMTNNHVIGSAAEAVGGMIEFNFQHDPEGRPRTPVRFELSPETFFATSPSEELDFTLVAVREVAGSGERLSGYGYKPLVAVSSEVVDGESVSIIQHPNGEPKQVALRENFVLKLPESTDAFLHYQTDTTPGSSGSPVYNDQWEVVALHHSGFPKRNAQGQILTPEGEVWTRAMGEHRIHWIANEGIRVAAIVERLRTLGGLSDAQKALLEVALRPGPMASPSIEEAETRTTVQKPPEQTGAGVTQPTLTTSSASTAPLSGSATWVMPLHVTVQFGMPAIQAGSSPVGLLSTTSGTPTSSSAAARELAEAAAKIERNASRPYYDPSTDTQARAGYYQGIATGLSPAALFAELAKLLRLTHQNQLGYDPSKHVYPWVDLQPNRKLKSVYSGQQFEPLEFVRQDIEIAQIRQRAVEDFLATEAVANPLTLEARVEELEASLPFNCEHVVPQSWFAKKMPMRGDLHHLFACESGCNSFRGNIPYFDFPDFNEAVRSQCGKREESKFEPGSGKGTVARASLYFLLRYPGQIKTSEYNADRLKVLLAWHSAFPVGEYERHRGQAIFEVQGNRNPLIDFPEWGARIDFAQGLG